MKKLIFFSIFLISFIFQSGNTSAQVEVPRNPDSAKECAICHFRWVDTFFLDGKGSDLVEYQSEKVVATSEMCFSCHDGSAVDSRDRVYNDLRHKINKPPPDHMKIPEIFPLDENGNMQCFTCHTAHGVASEMGIEKTIFIRTSNRDSKMCRMCHVDEDGGIDRGNHPIDTDKLAIPKKLIALGSVAAEKENQIICETCHTAHGSLNESFLIRSARNSELCLECHSDKKIFSPEGKRNPFHVINVKPVNAKIPDELISRGARLGDNGELICQTCHKMHRNRTEKKLLLLKIDEKSTLCLTCHGDKQYILETKHNLLHSSPEAKNMEGKTVAETGVCSACHLPHKAPIKLKGEEDYNTELCLSCHSKDGIAEKTDPGEYRHPVDVIPFKSDDPDVILTRVEIDKEKFSLPLFNKQGIPDINGKVVCSTCHDPHRWRSDSLKGEIKKDVKGDNKTSFLRKPAPDICMECHEGKFYIANSKHDIGKVAPESKNTLNQAPSESGICGTCHIAHGGQKSYLWARDITTVSGNVVQDLCVSCHNEEGMAKKKVVKDHSHPVNISLSDKGMTTSLPLYDQKGNLSKDGAMTCQTCHDPHCWDPVKIPSGEHYEIEGNVKNSFLRVETSPSPKLCEKCHPEKAYIEKTDHDLLVTAPEEKNMLEQTPAESGTCGVCHLMHNSKNKLKLWARSIGESSENKEIMNDLCTGCHSKGHLAEEKTVMTATHPEQYPINNSMRKDREAIDFFPIYDKHGAETTVGNVSCTSCHNAHQWNPLLNQKGAGHNLEGKVTDSFLRNISYNNICIDCHGLDALFRFKYFHDPEERVERPYK